MIKMIVFDMAGTTVNENMVVYKTLQKAINEAGFNFSLEQVLTEGAGKEKADAIRSILQVYAQKQDDNLTNDIYQHFIAQLACRNATAARHVEFATHVSISHTRESGTNVSRYTGTWSTNSHAE